MVFERLSGNTSRTLVCYADPSKSREILHWQAKRSVEEMCADSWRWQKQNPMGFED